MIYKNKHGRVILTSSDLDLPEFNYKNIQAGEARFLKTLDPVLINYMYQDKLLTIPLPSIFGESEAPNYAVAAWKIRSDGVIRKVYTTDVGTETEGPGGTWYDGTQALPVSSYYTRVDATSTLPSTGQQIGPFGTESYFTIAGSFAEYGWQTSLGFTNLNLDLTVGNNLGQSVTTAVSVTATAAQGGGN